MSCLFEPDTPAELLRNPFLPCKDALCDAGGGRRALVICGLLIGRTTELPTSRFAFPALSEPAMGFLSGVFVPSESHLPALLPSCVPSRASLEG